MIKTLQALLRNEDGATLVEYALVVALVAVVCIIAVRALGTNTNKSLSTSAMSL
jgi:pilus assembly protein Flp/PilA